MSEELPTPPSFWRTVQLLLGTAQKRAAGRRSRQQELFRERAPRDSTDWSGWVFAITALVMAALNVGAAFVVSMAVDVGERVEAEQKGKIVVSRLFLYEVNATSTYDSRTAEHYIGPYYRSEAAKIAEKYGGKEAVIEQKLRD